MREILAASAALLLLGAAVAHAEGAMVKVGHNRVEPAELSVAKGTSVTFVNEDAMPGGHTIVADDGSFSSPDLDKDQEWSHTFDAPGTYGFHIKQHPQAKGRITVE